MKLVYKLAISISAVLLVSVALWGVEFLNVITAEINDETDDMLEEFSRDIISRWLSGEQLPSVDNGTNNTYYVRPIGPEYASIIQWLEYTDEDIFISSKDEYEPARVRRQVFMDSEGKYYEVTVAIPTFERQDLRESVFWSIALLFVELTLVLIALVVLVLVFTMRPLSSLMKWLDTFVPGKENPPVPDASDVVEFHKLSQAAQSAADRFARQYRIQSQFISNASHELQTPLAVCQARIEMLLESQTLSEEQLHELMIMYSSIRNLIRLNRTLLMLSRIDNGQFLETEEVDIEAMLRDNAVSLNEINSHRSKHAEVTGSGCLWKMNSQLASVLVSNLLKNAFIHSPDGSEIMVRCDAGSFTVSNPGSKSLDTERIFIGFYQENPGKEDSTGLGLSLVKSICENSQLTVSYSFMGGRHVFTVMSNAIKLSDNQLIER